MPRRKRFSLEDYKEAMLNKTFGFITIIDVYAHPTTNRTMCKYICKCGTIKEAEAKRIFSGKLFSCGCYKSSNIFKSKISQWFKDNPEKVKERSDKYSQWCKDNPDKIKEKVDKYLQWCKDNPDKNIIRGDNISDIKKDNRLNKLSLFSNDELSKIHPDDLKLVLNGSIKGNLLLRVKCPNCGCYDYHRFDAIISLTNKTVSSQLCTNCYNAGKSHYEDELYNYIISLGCTCLRNDRAILEGKELDLYIPDKKVAIEFNGSYWHNETIKSKYYHYDKFIACLNKGIHLISIYEYDYNIQSKRDKLLQIIKHAITTNNTTRIYARDCIITKIDTAIANEYFNKYHFDGHSKQCNISYGLYYNNELVSVMSFGKLRGQNSLRHNNDYYELVRFVTKNEICVIGGCSKLLSAFIHDYNPKYILCYSDNDFFTGEVYNKLGFKLKSLGEKSIDYQWCNNKECLSRNQCMSSKLLDKYPKYKNISISGSKEKYIMEDLGYYRIYRCGNSIWEWLKN